ncbi:hypothetical protein GHO26_12220 [Pseudomonas helleri]|uniref:hypothetical protein n=1 Tax=Pseudomonas helleri TaxID=1608996 RepID=UPI0012975C3F|nr:hypothetical protein [Pseudomonas helleri]MQU58545.1 hypothetical protein [Pseudomonas helleri]
MPLETPELISLKLGQAAKNGKNARGLLSYRVVCSVDRQDISLVLVGNEGGGWFSSELVPLTRIEGMLESDGSDDTAIPVNALRAVFVSRSANNAGFLAAVLVTEGLLELTEGSPRRYVRTDSWDRWKRAMLSEQGESFAPEVKKTPILAALEVAQEDGQGTGKKRKKSRPAGNSASCAQMQGEVTDLPDQDSAEPGESANDSPE